MHARARGPRPCLVFVLYNLQLVHCARVHVLAYMAYVLGTASQHPTGQKRFPEHNGRLDEGAFSAEPAAGDHPWGDWGLGGAVAPVVGPPTHPVMPNLVIKLTILVVLWEMSPLRGGVRAGARLWARGPAHRSWVATGPKPKPGGAVGPLGPPRGAARDQPRVTF
jgi:hypothetical protein